MNPTLAARLARRDAARRIAAAAANPDVLTVAVRVQGGIGDVLLASPLIEALYDALGGLAAIDVLYHQPAVAAFVFSQARFVREVKTSLVIERAVSGYDMTVRTGHFISYTVKDTKKLQRLVPSAWSWLDEAATRYAAVKGLAERQPLLDGLWARQSVREGRGMLDTIGYISGLDVTRDSEIFLALEPQALAGMPPAWSSVLSRNYITVHDGFDNDQKIAPGEATKCWPVERWARMVQELKTQEPDLRIVQLGAKKSRRIPGVDLNLVDITTLQQAAWIMKRARLHADSESGLVHLARALHVPSVVLFGPTDPAYYGHAVNTNLSPVICGNCFWSTPDWLAKCPRGGPGAPCMTSITVERVVTSVRERLAVAAPTYEAGPLSLYDGADTYASRIDQMCDRLGLTSRPISQHITDVATGLYIHASKQWEYGFALENMPNGVRLEIADVGGGRGALAAYLALSGHDVSVYDLDYEWGGTRETERTFRAKVKHHYAAKFGSCYNLPVASDSVDVALCISVVEHVPEKSAVLRELLRIVKPGGSLILTFDFADNPERFEDVMRREIFSGERLTTALAAVGIAFDAPNASAVAVGAARIQADGVAGIPAGMTVGGLVIKKAAGA